MRAKSLLFGLLGVISIAHLAGFLIGTPELTTFTKPLLLPVLIAALLMLAPRPSGPTLLLALFGLLFSWFGDLALMVSGSTWFLIGLGFFFAAHVFYVVVFVRKTAVKPLPWWSAVYAVWWLTLLIILAPHLGEMLIPVAAYGLILGLMGVFAARGNLLLTLGGALFVISDSILALNRFLPKEILTIPLSGFWVMLTYILAQALITLGILKVLNSRTPAKETA